MKRIGAVTALCLVVWSLAVAQSSTSAPPAVPRMIRYSGILTAADGTPRTGAVGIMFSLYSDQQGGTALWTELQNVQLNERGEYSVLLGSQHADGVPAELFAANAARWLGLQLESEAEQPRVLLVSVPYALKAAVADSLNGFTVDQILAARGSASPAINSASADTTITLGRTVRAATSTLGAPAGPGPRVTLLLNGTPAGVLEAYDDSTIQPLPLLLNPQGGNIGLGTDTPASPVTVGKIGNYEWGVGNSWGDFSLSDGTVGFAIGVATFGGGKGDVRLWPMGGTKRVIFGDSTGGDTLTIQGGKVGIGNIDPSSTLDVTGNIKASGNVTATSFSGSGSGLTGVAQLGAQNILTAVPAGTAVDQGTLYINPATATASQTLLGVAVGGTQEFKVDSSGSVSVAGSINLPSTVNSTTGVITLGGSPFLFGYGGNVFVGAAGNFTNSGVFNTAVGLSALSTDVSGRDNTALGTSALYANTLGDMNTAVGSAALASDTTGFYNTAVGYRAGVSTDNTKATTTGYQNTFLGYAAGPGTTTQLNNATAIGANAVVGASNSVVLGGISGVNGATSDVNVGIGTSAPAYKLDVQGGQINAPAGVLTGSLTLPASNLGSGTGVIYLGNSRFLHDAPNGTNTFVGYSAGGLSTSASDNTGIGEGALLSDLTGASNTAVGSFALSANQSGSNNSAFGVGAGGAIFTNYINLSGSNNTFLGYATRPATFTQLNNATAIGANAAVSADNTMVLGSINGVNGATADTSVGIGTTATGAIAKLNVVGGAIAIGATAQTADAALHITSSFGCCGRLSQMSTTGTSKAALNLMGSTTGGGAQQFWAWGVDADNTWKIQPTVTFTSTGGLIIDASGNTRVAGNLTVIGSVSKGSGSFKIDHPLDPENKYLYHSFVESPDMMNVYNGNIVLDGKGEAWVALPDWFEALNRDFRYQLTALGAPGPNLYVARKVEKNRFKIAGGKPGSEVSWQITGIRKDAYAEKHRIPVEEDKPAAERGTYLYPDAFDQPESRRQR